MVSYLLLWFGVLALVAGVGAVFVVRQRYAALNDKLGGENNRVIGTEAWRTFQQLSGKSKGEPPKRQI